MVRLELLDLLALLDPLEREESKGSLDLLASRVSPDHLGPQEREGNLVTRVFPARVVLLVPLDPEVSVVSLERGEEPDLRVFRDLVDFLVLPEPMDPRELLDLLVVLEPRDLPACKVCQEREELVAFPGPRVTEVTMERRDLRVLLARTGQEV